MNELVNLEDITGISCEGGQNFNRYFTIDYFGKHNYYDIPVNKSMEKTKFDDSYPFSNGFRIIRMEDGKFGYIREEDNFLMPYRYDIASDFNEYGFAMIGKNGYVSWINKDFKYYVTNSYKLPAIFNFVTEDFSYKDTKFNSNISRVDQFSIGNNPLSRISLKGNTITKNTLQNSEVRNNLTVYMDTNGKIKDFINFEDRSKISRSVFTNGNNFNKHGYTYADDNSHILFDSGYYLGLEDVVNLAKKHGLLDEMLQEEKELVKIKFKKI